MSLYTKELDQLARIARRVVQLIDATTIAITDIEPSAGTSLTRDQIATLCNRYFNEQEPHLHKPPHQRTGADLDETA